MSKTCDVFVSYSRHDQNRVRPWVSRLQAGGLEVFFDTESLVGGVEWREAIVEAIAACKLVIFIASKTAFESDYVPKELALAEQNKKGILPIFLDGATPSKKIAFILADVHHINAADKSDGELWHEIQRSLSVHGLTWSEKESPESDSGNRTRRKRADDWLEWTTDDTKIDATDQGEASLQKNERRRTGPLTPSSVQPLKKEEIDDKEWAGPTSPASAEIREPAPSPAKDDSTDGDKIPGEETKDLPFVRLAATAALVLAAIAVAYFALSPGEDSQSSAKPDNPTTPEPPVPKAERVEAPKPRLFADVAKEIVEKYYSAPEREGPMAQLAFLADPVEDYFDSGPLPLARVKEDHAKYAAIWPSQRFVVTKTAVTEDVGGDAAVCETDVTFTIENDAVIQSGAFKGRLKVAAVKGEERIVSVAEVPGSRHQNGNQFKFEGQGKRGVSLVEKAVLSGNTDPSTAPEDVAAMFTQEPQYYGVKTPKADIIAQLNRIAALPVRRRFEIRGQPVINKGADASRVVITVEIYFEAFRRNESTPFNKGTVTAEYGLVFSNGGTPLIESVVETGRQTQSTVK